jgi:hypothetical protein
MSGGFRNGDTSFSPLGTCRGDDISLKIIENISQI